VSRSTVTADSVPRQPICRFTFPEPPPFRLSFHLCVSRCTGAFPVGSSVERDSSEWSRVRSAACSVARVCQLTPFRSRTTLCLLSLLHHRGRWVSLTYHGMILGYVGGLVSDGCEVRLCDPCARVRLCVPCVSRLPRCPFTYLLPA
jgi:hypothetical protein